MMRALLGKEIREHWPVMLVLGAVATLLFAMIAIGQVHVGAPAFEILRIHLMLTVPIAAWTLGGRIVRREYAGSTQLFLDALPVPRAAVVSAKYLLGAAALACTIVPAFAFCWLLALRGHDVSGRFLAIVAARTIGYAWFLWAAAFLLGFLGRYRTPLLLVAILGGIVALHDTDVEAGDFGPLGLAGTTFAFERNLVPWGLLLSAGATAAGLTAAAFLVAGLREGSVAARLAQEMSHRERAFAGVAVLVALTAAATLREKRRKEPFAPPVAHKVETEGVSVVVGAGSGMSEADATRLAQETHGRLAALRRDLGIAALPQVFLFARRGLDAKRYEHGTIEEEAGVVVRIGYPDPAWDPSRFVGWLAGVVLEEHTHGRALLESRRWVLDGYCEVLAAGTALDAPLSDDPFLLARALHGTARHGAGGVTRERLASWLSFREQVGEDVARAVAWSGLRALARARGADRARAFLAEMLGLEPPDDVRALRWETEHGVAAALERTAGTELDGLVREWNAALDDARGAVGESPRQVPAVTADVRVVEVSDASREIEFTARLDPAPAGGVSVRFEWVSLDPFETEPGPERWISDEAPLAQAASGRRLRHVFQRGERIAWRVAYRSETLACDVSSPVRRTVIE